MRLLHAAARAGSVVCLAALFGFAAGCGGKSEEDLNLVPVKGKVTLNGVPLTSGQVTFHPNADKGNASPRMASGQIQADGTYSIVTGVDGVTKEGTPPGWYRVTVAPVASSENTKGKSLSYNQDNSTVKNSPHAFEVKAGTAAYDIKLKP